MATCDCLSLGESIYLDRKGSKTNPTTLLVSLLCPQEIYKLTHFNGFCIFFVFFFGWLRQVELSSNVSLIGCPETTSSAVNFLLVEFTCAKRALHIALCVRPKVGQYIYLSM